MAVIPKYSLVQKWSLSNSFQKKQILALKVIAHMYVKKTYFTAALSTSEGHLGLTLAIAVST